MNLDRFRKSGRLNRASLAGRHTILIVLVLLLAVLLVGTTVLALDGKPTGRDGFDSGEALREVSGILAVTAKTAGCWIMTGATWMYDQ